MTTNNRIPEDKLAALRELARAYYEARDAIGHEYLDPWIDPETYMVDGALDTEAYRASLIELRDYTLDLRIYYQVKQHNHQIDTFGYYRFETYRRLRQTDDKDIDA